MVGVRSWVRGDVIPIRFSTLTKRVDRRYQGGDAMSKKGWSMARWSVLAVTALVLCLVVGAAPAAGADGARYVDKNATRNCAGKTPCYANIQAAVNNAQPGDTIYVFPGTYNAGVDLNQMNPQGDISLITVDASGNPAPGTVTIDNPGDASEIYTGNPLMPFNGDVTIDGFVLRSFYGAIDLWVAGGTDAPAGAEGGLGPFLSRDVEIRNVDASHTGGDGITVRAEGDVTIKNCTTNDNEGYGIGVEYALGDVTITGCTSNDNKGPSISLGGVSFCYAGGICVGGAGGEVLIKNSTANGNGTEGIVVFPLVGGGQEADVAVLPASGGVIIDRCTANNNGSTGIAVRSLPTDVTITDCTANGNGDDGIFVAAFLIGDEPSLGLVIDGGDVTIQNCTANGNDLSGFHVVHVPGVLSILACIARDNVDGVNLDGTYDAEAVLVNGNIICGNECGVNLSPTDFLGINGAPINLEGNWWGCAEGPEAVGCDAICEVGEDSIAVDFTPWIKKISASATVDPVNVGESTVVSFEFSGGSPALYLGEGPGDRRGPAPFTVTTDNGSLNGNGSTVKEFVGANGLLEVTLVPDRGGAATVTVSGPCGLEKSIVLGAESEFVSEPGSMLLLASGLMGLAGYATLRLRKR
jgi:hypothetical protein